MTFNDKIKYFQGMEFAFLKILQPGIQCNPNVPNCPQMSPEISPAMDMLTPQGSAKTSSLGDSHVVDLKIVT